MGAEVVAVCERSASLGTPQGLSVFLSVVFCIYVLFDSVLISWVITRKAREAEHSSRTEPFS